MTDRMPPAWRRHALWTIPTTALPAEIAALLRLNSQTRVLRPVDPLVPVDQLLARCYAPISPAAAPPVAPAAGPDVRLVPADTAEGGGDP